MRKDAHDGPGLSSGDGSSESEDLSGQEPPHKTNGVLGLVVGGDGNVNELEGGIGVTEGDDGDVDEGRLSDSLVVDSGVGHDDDSGLLERSGDVVGAGWERRKVSNSEREHYATKKTTHKLPGVNRPAMA